MPVPAVAAKTRPGAGGGADAHGERAGRHGQQGQVEALGQELGRADGGQVGALPDGEHRDPHSGGDAAGSGGQCAEPLQVHSGPGDRVGEEEVECAGLRIARSGTGSGCRP